MGKKDELDANANVSAKKSLTPIRNVIICASNIFRLEKNRRSVTTNCYGMETISPDAATAKQANFLTNQPLRWYQAVSKYNIDKNIINRCEVSTRKDKKVDKVSILKIRMSLEVRNEIVFVINFNTGVINIKGTSCRDWVAKELPKIKTLVDVQEQPDTKDSSQPNNKEVPAEITPIVPASGTQKQLDTEDSNQPNNKRGAR